MRIQLAVPLDSHTGYGRDGIGLVEAMTRWGIDVRLVSPQVSAPLPPAVQAALGREPYEDLDLIIHHLNPGVLRVLEGDLLTAPSIFAWTMWEWTSLSNVIQPAHLQEKDWAELHERYEGYDHVFAYDGVTRQALEPLAPSMSILQGGYDPGIWNRPSQLGKPRDWSGREFNFCMVGDLNDRKNPFVAIRAFKELKAEGQLAHANLTLKTQGEVFPKHMEAWLPGLQLVNESMTSVELRAFYETQHCLIAPSRGEGKNLPPMEFATTGGAVIVSNWGGHQQWANPEYTWLVGGQPIPYLDFENCNWFDTDKEELKQVMLEVYENRFRTREKARMAAQILPRRHSWDAVLTRFFEQVKLQVPGGEELYFKAQKCKRDGMLPPNLASAL